MNESWIHVGNGVLTVSRAAPWTWNYRISDFGLDYRGQFEIALCEDNAVEALCELVRRLFTAAAMRRERLEGSPSSVIDRWFPEAVLKWVNAHADELTGFETDCQKWAMAAES